MCLIVNLTFPVFVRPEPGGEWAGSRWSQSSGYDDSKTAAGTGPKTGNRRHLCQHTSRQRWGFMMRLICCCSPGTVSRDHIVASCRIFELSPSQQSATLSILINLFCVYNCSCSIYKIEIHSHIKKNLTFRPLILIFIFLLPWPVN